MMLSIRLAKRSRPAFAANVSSMASDIPCPIQWRLQRKTLSYLPLCPAGGGIANRLTPSTSGLRGTAGCHLPDGSLALALPATVAQTASILCLTDRSVHPTPPPNSSLGSTNLQPATLCSLSVTFSVPWAPVPRRGPSGLA